MNGWFTRKQAMFDAVVSTGAASFVWFWFAQVLGLAGSLGLVSALFAAAQLVRFVNAQLAALEWAKLQEAGLPEKQPKAIVPRGDGYRDAAVIDEVPSPDTARDETEIRRTRSRAHRSLGIVATSAALATLVPGFAFGAWAVPVVLGFVAALAALFLLTMRGMRRRQARAADDAFVRQRVAVDPLRVRVGVDFGVPAEERAEVEELKRHQRY